jgi:16S rRNA (guanine527-N7)-methyltransferase
VEQNDLIARWALSRGLHISDTATDKLVRYALLLHDQNRKINLTAFKTIEEIISNLIIGSLDPLCRMRVPRGTRFVDIGTGSGIPGIPFSIFFEDACGMLLDSSLKKIEFLELVIKSIGIPSLSF